MRKRPFFTRGRLSLLVVPIVSSWAMPLPAADAEPASADSLAWRSSRPSFPRAAIEVLSTNLAVWSFDRFIREGGNNPEFRIGTNSIWENIQNGFEWDNNNFGTNNFSHPYHGSIYFNAARSNGYGYWESIPFVFAGSYLWEYTGEINNAAYNDWVNTSVGGIVLGESLYRLSGLVLDNRAKGSGRFWRETAALMISPMRGINRIVTGEWSKVGPNPPDGRTNQLRLRLQTGLRSQGQEGFAKKDTSGVFLSTDLSYGDAFTLDEIRPFDEFSFNAQFNFNDVDPIGRVQIRALLFGNTVHESPRTKHILGAYQAFEFIDNRGYEYGGQNVGAIWLARHGPRDRGIALETELGLGIMLLGGTSSEIESFTGRDYDYGSGLSYRGVVRLLRGARTAIEFKSSGTWLHTLNGPDGNYFVTIHKLAGTLPLRGNLSLGAEIRANHRQAWYDEFSDVGLWFPEARAFFELSPR